MLELNQIKPELDLMDGPEIKREKWKAFKKEFGFTSASMCHLMKEAGNDWLSKKVTVYGRNVQLSKEAQTAFKSFLALKRVVQPGGMASFNTMDERTRLGGWKNNITNTLIRSGGNTMSLGIIDFRMIPGASHPGTIESPFYYSFMKMMDDNGCPRMTEVPTWLWICDTNTRVQVEMLYQNRLLPFFDIVHSSYEPGSWETLARPQELKKLRDYMVSLIFLFKKNKSKSLSDERKAKFKGVFKPLCVNKNVVRSVLDEYKYTVETEYELRMDFYIDVLQNAVEKGQIVFNMFGGTKLMYAGLVMNLNSFWLR